MSGAVLEARAVIRGEDRTKGAFDSIEARIRKLVGQIAVVDRVMGRVQQVAAPINEATQAVRKFEMAAESMKLIDQQAAAVRRSFAETAESIEKATAAATKFGKVKLSPNAGHGADEAGHRGKGGHSRFEALREVAGGLAPMVGLGLAFEGAEAVRGAVKGGFERQHERVRMTTAGMSPGEIGEAEHAAADLTARYPAVGQTEIMHLMRNARSVVGSYDEAAKILQPLLDLRVVAGGAHPGQAMEEDFDQLIKGMEIKGVTQDPAKFRSYINSMGKAVNAFGDTLRPTDFYEMFKYGRQSTSGFSEDYMMTVAPTLAQEMKGSSAGVANSAFFRAIVGGRMEKGALQHLKDLGLVDESKLVVPKGGHLASAAGAIKGTQLAQVNPYEWVNQILLPAMQKKGVVDPQKIQEVINSVFSNQVAAQMVGIYATQQARIEKDRGVIAHTMDTPAAAREIMNHDPLIAAEGLKNAIENLGAVFADKTLHLAGGMTTLAEGIGRFTAQLQHAYDKPNDGQASPGQQRFNGIANDVVSWWYGQAQTHAKGGYAEGRRASLIATAVDLDGRGADVDYDAYENSRNAGRLFHDQRELIMSGKMGTLETPAGFVTKAHAIGELRGLAQKQVKDAREARDYVRMAGQLQEVDDGLDSYDGSLWRRATTQPPAVSPTVPSGPAWFPQGRSYADLPLPSDQPWNPPRDGGAGGSASPPAEEHHEDPTEALKAALSGGTFMAQLDPGSKAEISASFEVKPSSELLQVVEKAKSLVAAGSLSAGGFGGTGSTGVSYPETAPAGRGMGPR